MRKLTTIERVQKLLGEPDPRLTIEPKSKFMHTSQSSVGQQVAAQAAGNVLAGDINHKEVIFPASGDWETELINMVNVFVGTTLDVGPNSVFVNRRLAGLFDYLASRYRTSAQELEWQQQQLFHQISQATPSGSHAPAYAKDPGYWGRHTIASGPPSVGIGGQPMAIDAETQKSLLKSLGMVR